MASRKKIYRPIWTAGYGTSSKASGDAARLGPRDPRELVLAARKLDALVLDIRLSPVSQLPGWDYKALQAVLDSRYIHLPQLGNINFNNKGPIQLASAKVGIAEVLRMSGAGRTCILLCGCADYGKCHRAQVAHLLYEAQVAESVVSPQIRELEWPHVPELDLAQYPDIALSIQQPWAWLICNGYKDIENRSWHTKMRGRVLVHAPQTFDLDAHGQMCQTRYEIARKMPKIGDFDRGGIVGEMTITDCVEESGSSWFFGPFGFKIEKAAPLPFHPLNGALNFFSPSKQSAPVPKKGQPRVTRAAKSAGPPIIPASPRSASEPYAVAPEPSLNLFSDEE